MLTRDIQKCPDPLAPRRPGIRILLKTTSTQRGDKPPNEIIGLVEGIIQTSDSMGEVRYGQIIERIRTISKARIQKWGKHVERMDGYSNDEDVLRSVIRIYPEMDGSDAAGSLREAGRGHGQRGLQQDQGVNLGLLDDVALLQEPPDVPSQVEETDLEERNVPISIL